MSDVDLLVAADDVTLEELYKALASSETRLGRKVSPTLDTAYASEFDGIIRSGKVRLEDAGNEALSAEGRFDLAYNAAHALALAALRWHGYRCENRYLVFQCLKHTLNVPNGQCRRLAV
ncbi:MAG TPA: hypothetical protein VFB99_12705 [Vicinamibacterales bacterium]|nr:hypothetical protein [Vicinamibacterales bacterium]